MSSTRNETCAVLDLEGTWHLLTLVFNTDPHNHHRTIYPMRLSLTCNTEIQFLKNTHNNRTMYKVIG